MKACLVDQLMLLGLSHFDVITTFVAVVAAAPWIVKSGDWYYLVYSGCSFDRPGVRNDGLLCA